MKRKGKGKSASKKSAEILAFVKRRLDELAADAAAAQELADSAVPPEPVVASPPAAARAAKPPRKPSTFPAPGFRPPDFYANESVGNLDLPVDCIVNRYRDEHPIVGPHVLVRPMREMAEALAVSAHMKSWVIMAIMKAMTAGEQFVYRGSSGKLRATYRLCTEKDIEILAADRQYRSATMRASEMKGTGLKDITHTKGYKRNPRNKMLPFSEGS